MCDHDFPTPRFWPPVFLAMALLASVHLPGMAVELESLGYLDVVASCNADPTGNRDSTEQIMRAIETAKARRLVVYFPPGTYKVSDTIDCVYHDDKSVATRIVGSTRSAGERATIYLAPNSEGFGNPNSPKVVLHLRRHNEGNADHYEQSVMGVDVRVGAGNAGAIGVRHQGAENTHLEDMTIDLSESGYAGLWGVPGSGGSTHRIRVIGGRIGVSTYDANVIQGVTHKHPLTSQPTPALTGIVLQNQSDYALLVNSRGPQVMVGCRIITHKQGPVIKLGEVWKGDCLSGQLNLIDSSIDYARPSDKNTVIEMDAAGRSFVMENCFIRNASCVFKPELAANPSGWAHVRRLGYAHVGYHEGVLPYGLLETPYANGQAAPRNYYYDRAEDAAPPADLCARHKWTDDFPTFESEGAVNVKADFGAAGDGQTDDLAALQAAVDRAEIVFLPKGRYLISDTLHLKKNTKLIGVHSSLTQILSRDTSARRFGNANRPTQAGIPMIDTPDEAGGDVVIAGVNISSSWPIANHDPTQIESYALRWRCHAVFRDVHVHPFKTAHYHPRRVIEDYYDQGEDFPHNGSYPGEMDLDVLPRKWPLIYATGHGSGRYYNFFLHGDHYEEYEGRLIKIVGTTNPISIYHFHCQHNQGDYYLEAIGAQHLSVYGSKSEGTFGIARFENCDHIRYFGHGGIGTPAPDNPRGIDWFFAFDSVPNFVFGGFAPQLYGSGGHWRSHQAPYHRWWHGSHADNHVLIEARDGQPTVLPDKHHSPILYVRGNPSTR